MAQLSREKFFRLNDASRERIYASRRVNAAIRHAQWSAERYAKLLLADGIVENNLTYRGRYAWTPKNRLELAGGETGIRETMGRNYAVPDALRNYAARIVIGLLLEQA